MNSFLDGRTDGGLNKIGDVVLKRPPDSMGVLVADHHVLHDFWWNQDHEDQTRCADYHQHWIQRHSLCQGGQGHGHPGCRQEAF